MTAKDLLTISATILGSLGGGALIIGAFTHWLGTVWAKRLIQNEKKNLDAELESYKVKLKKSEMLFQKEFEAAVELSSILIKHLNTLTCNSNDILRYIAQNFMKIDNGIKSFLLKNRILLNSDIIDLLYKCLQITSAYQNVNPHNISNSESELEDAKRIKVLLIQAEELMINQVHSQSSN